ncbi:unnamed protein product [Caenorhabditis auriculariae]|uniref:ATP-grasp domain-containing protein n=1 Tax=Caenorhabditis auriculariae TaxID=2777116 RepID=A0A8S1HPR3_9PELO|nr:unnamed protein product [Caenorhabditis auriculariae]
MVLILTVHKTTTHYTTSPVANRRPRARPYTRWKNFDELFLRSLWGLSTHKVSIINSLSSGDHALFICACRKWLRGVCLARPMASSQVLAVLRGKDKHETTTWFKLISAVNRLLSVSLRISRRTLSSATAASPLHADMPGCTVIVVLWKYRLNLSRLRRRDGVRVIVVAPPRMLVDETNVDVYYQVEPPIRDHDHCLLMHKVRELCSIFASSVRRIVVFERCLQRAMAQIRKEMDVEGFRPEQLEQFFHSGDAFSKRNGLSTLKQCSLSGTPQPDSWVEAVRSQIGGFPAVVRPLRHHCAHSVGFIRDESEFKNWFRRNSSVHRNEQYLVQEYMDDGHEFTAVCTFQRGLVGCISSMETHRSVLECIQNQQPYGLELLSTDQTRDIMPGLESFTIQVTKNVFPNGYLGALFIRGYYKDHNEIFFYGFGLEPENETSRLLLALPGPSPWENILIEAQAEDELTKEPEERNQYHYCVLNFPSAEGVLIHQTSVQKRSSEMRVAWRSAESSEMKDSDHVDDNVMQVFLWHESRPQLLLDCEDILRSTDITIDKNVLNERHNLCRRNLGRHAAKELVRSCTTAD